MFKLLKTVFKAGDVTTKYPFKPYEVDEDFRGNQNLILINVLSARRGEATTFNTKTFRIKCWRNSTEISISHPLQPPQSTR